MQFPNVWSSTLRPITVTNTLTGKKESLRPIHPGKIGMYACGVTVYDYCHIGHALQAIYFDVIRNYLTYAGYEVKYVRNFTDVDDKIINRAKERGISPAKLASDMVKASDEDMAALDIRPADQQPKVSEMIPQIIAMVERLIENGAAYRTKEGDVYFRVRAKADYGKLSGQKPDEMRSGTRQIVQGNKEDEMDFALWKRDETPEASWDGPWGRGRPGWHIECSAMALECLGPSFDIHGGGRDLVFPHHENEIAQSEAANKAPFASIWIHNGLVTIDHQKMSKSLGNHLLIRDAVTKWPAEAIRYNFLTHHYGSNVDFSEDAFKNGVRRIHYYYGTLAQLDLLAAGTAPHKGPSEIFDAEKVKENFHRSMSDDFNSAAALADMNLTFRQAHEIIKAGAKMRPIAALCAATLREIGAVLGLFKADPVSFLANVRDQLLRDMNIDQATIDEAIARRIEARKNKDFKTSDEIRKEMADKGIDLMDGKEGTTWGIHLTTDGN